MVNSGCMWVNKVERGSQGVYQGKRGRTRLNWSKRDVTYSGYMWINELDKGYTRDNEVWDVLWA